jgi:hypothetical protein
LNIWTTVWLLSGETTAEECCRIRNPWHEYGYFRRAILLLGISQSWATLANQLDRLAIIVEKESE